MQRGNVVATFDCEVSPDKLETLCFQPSGFSVRTTVTYCDPYSQERGRNGLFATGDPVDLMDPFGLAPDSSAGNSWWGQLKDWYSRTFGEKAPLTDINNFFNNTPNNYYAPDPTANQGTIIFDPNAPPTTKSIQFSNPLSVTIVNGAIYSVWNGAGDPELDPNSNPLPDTPKSLQGVGKNDGVENAQTIVDAANSVIAGQIQAYNQMRSFAFVYNPNTGGYYVMDISGINNDPPTPGQYLPPSQGSSVLRSEFKYYNMAPSNNINPLPTK